MYNWYKDGSKCSALTIVFAGFSKETTFKRHILKVKNESGGPESITYSPETVPVIC